MLSPLVGRGDVEREAVRPVLVANLERGRLHLEYDAVQSLDPVLVPQDGGLGGVGRECYDNIHVLKRDV